MEESNPPDYIKAMLLGILLLFGVVVLLIFGYLTITYRRGGMIPRRGHAVVGRGFCQGTSWDLRAARCLQLAGVHGLVQCAKLSFSMPPWDRYLHAQGRRVILGPACPS